MNFVHYYENQSGSGLPVFHGAKHQRGSGLGNIFKSFYRWIIPVLKTHALPVLNESAKALGTEAIRTIRNSANDTLDGVRFRDSLKRRTKEAVDSLAIQAEEALQSGDGYKRRRRSRKTRITKKQKPQKKRRQIRKKIKKRAVKRKVARKRKIAVKTKPGPTKKRRTKQDILDSI